MELVENYGSDWKLYAIGMSRLRISFQITRYQSVGRRTLGKPFRLWNEKV